MANRFGVRQGDVNINKYYIVYSDLRQMLIKCKGIAANTRNITGPAVSVGGILVYCSACVTVPFEKIIRLAGQEEINLAKENAQKFINEF